MFVKITTAIWLNGSKALPGNMADVRRTSRGDTGRMFDCGGVRYQKVWTTNETNSYLHAISTNTTVLIDNRIPSNYHRFFCPRTISGDTDRKYYFYYYSSAVFVRYPSAAATRRRTLDARNIDDDRDDTPTTTIPPWRG